jgi:hypothetical protein
MCPVLVSYPGHTETPEGPAQTSAPARACTGANRRPERDSGYRTKPLAGTHATYVSRKEAEVVDTKQEFVAHVSDDLATFPAAPVDTASPFESSYREQGVRNDPQAA